MKIQSILIAIALGASTCLLQAQPDQGQGGPGGQRPGRRQNGGPGGPGGGPGMQGGGVHILPPFAQEQLNLTDAQKKQIADLEKETKAKLDTILTDEQKQKLKDMRGQFRGRGQGGQRGPGGPGQGQGPGGRGPGGPPPSDQ